MSLVWFFLRNVVCLQDHAVDCTEILANFLAMMTHLSVRFWGRTWN